VVTTENGARLYATAFKNTDAEDLRDPGGQQELELEIWKRRC
jgi:hypothetical protein